jgi:hypothetical protein
MCALLEFMASFVLAGLALVKSAFGLAANSQSVQHLAPHG